MSAAPKLPARPVHASVIEMARKAGQDEFYADEFAKVLRELLNVPMASGEHRNAVVAAGALLATFDEARTGLAS